MLIESVEQLGRYDTVYVSPHLDDVALSCPVRILRETARGERALVATLFTRGDGYEQRKEEDRRAMAILGVDHLHADLPDAPFRSATYGSFAGIVYGRDPGDGAAQARAFRALESTLTRARPRLCVAPLGVGTHIDHRIAHEASWALPVETIFYEDRPYALCQGAVALRLHELGFEPPALPDDAAIERSFLEAAYVQSYLPEASRDNVLSRLRSQAATARTIRRSAKPDLAESRALADADPERVAEVVASYASQVKEVLGSVERYLSECAKGSERLWRLPR